jgi:hypothetical protein
MVVDYKALLYIQYKGNTYDHILSALISANEQEN